MVVIRVVRVVGLVRVRWMRVCCCCHLLHRSSDSKTAVVVVVKPTCLVVERGRNEKKGCSRNCREQGLGKKSV